MPKIIINAEALAAEIEASVKTLRTSACETESFCILRLASGIEVQVQVTREKELFHDESLDGLAHLST